VERFCEHLIEHVRTLLLLRVCGEGTDLVEVPESVRATLIEQAGSFDAPTYVYMISLLEELRRSVKSSGAARALADAAVVRLAMSHQFTDLTALIERLDGGGAPAKAKKKASAEVRSSGSSTGSAPPENPGVSGLGPAVGGAAAVSAPVSTPTRSVGARGPAGMTPGSAGQAIRSEQWKQASRDPLVQKVTDAVEGTLFDVRRVEPPAPAEAKIDGQEEVNENDPTMLSEE
jgi:hypothetical protein